MTAAEKMVQRINEEIKWAQENFEGSFDDVHQMRMTKIYAMIEMLQIVTGKDYIVTNDGLVER